MTATESLANELAVLAAAVRPADLANPFGETAATAVIRSRPEDFQVTELPLATPSGEGEHAWLRIQKTGNNTAWVAKQLAEFAGVQRRDVSYAGLKDRHAVTEQWFSVWLPGKPDPDWSQFVVPGVEVLEVARHRSKLRRGELAANRFSLVLREFDGDADALRERCALVAQKGVPNYFGEQRFGRAGGNLQLLSGTRRPDRDERSLGYSAYRSAMFNLYLNQRVKDGFWNVCDSDEGTNDVPLSDRDGGVSGYALPGIEVGDERPTGILWGTGRGRITPVESGFFAQFPTMTGQLEEAGLKRHRRSLWLPVADFQTELKDGLLTLSFCLPPGAFATTVLDALLRYTLGNRA